MPRRLCFGAMAGALIVLGMAGAALAGDTLATALRAQLSIEEAADHGIFHTDITPAVAPYFTSGSSLAETQRVLREQGLPPLQRFHGASDRAEETIFVSRVPLSTTSEGEVHAVLDFEFDGTSEADMRLRKVSAFLQSASM